MKRKPRKFHMFEVLFSERAKLYIEIFITNYREGFFDLYKDTGIWAEELLKQNYEKAAIVLNDTLIDEIIFKLNQDVVLGRNEFSDELSQIDFFMERRFISIQYSENQAKKIRTVEHVTIGGKLISF